MILAIAAPVLVIVGIMALERRAKRVQRQLRQRAPQDDQDLIGDSWLTGG